MNYLLMPLHAHADLGFGATADAFQEAADKLEEQFASASAQFNRHLPINYLRRHAVELYLKSGIIIFHRVLQLPYGSQPWNADPMVLLDNGNWRHMYNIHRIGTLHKYFSRLFEDHRDFLSENTRTNWEFPEELAEYIATIEKCDPDSTHSRYPVTRDPAIDHIKSSVAEASIEKLFGAMKEPKDPVKAVLVYNDKDELVQSYSLTSEPMQELGTALAAVVTILSDCHAAMRGELTGTN